MGKERKIKRKKRELMYDEGMKVAIQEKEKEGNMIRIKKKMKNK